MSARLCRLAAFALTVAACVAYLRAGPSEAAFGLLFVATSCLLLADSAARQP